MRQYKLCIQIIIIIIIVIKKNKRIKIKRKRRTMREDRDKKGRFLNFFSLRFFLRFTEIGL